MSRVHVTPDDGQALAGLARKVDSLERAWDTVTTRTTSDINNLGAKVDGINRAIKDLAAALTTLSQGEAGPDEPDGTEFKVEWLTVKNPDAATELLLALDEWIDRVWVHYGVSVVPCWPYHPAIVAELHAARVAWEAALVPDARALAMNEWHDRVRPGVSERIAKYTSCMSANGGHTNGKTRWTADIHGRLPEIASWWVQHHNPSALPAPGLDPS